MCSALHRSAWACRKLRGRRSYQLRERTQSSRVVSCLLLPVVGEPGNHVVGLVAQEVGSRVTEYPPADRLGHKCHHRGEGSVPHRHPVILQIGLGAAKRDGVEVRLKLRGGSPNGVLAITAAVSRSVIVRSVL